MPSRSVNLRSSSISRQSSILIPCRIKRLSQARITRRCAKPRQSLAADFFQPELAEVPPDLAQHAAASMGPGAQLLTGAFPALFGGTMTNNDTPPDTRWRAIMQMLSNPDPQIQSVLAHPENMALVKRLVGLEEMVIQHEESRTKQYREIGQLVAESPVEKRHDASGVELMLPSIVPDGFADNHAVELDVCLRCFSSDGGQVAKIEAPAGYVNVRAHALFDRDYLRKQQKPQQGSA